MIGTSGRQRVSAKDLAEYEVGRPDADALARFGALAEPLLDAVARLRDERRTLANLRDTLLPHLMSGRLRVKDAEKQVEAVV
jgi:type I restriction enzyme, S subunit